MLRRLIGCLTTLALFAGAGQRTLAQTQAPLKLTAPIKVTVKPHLVAPRYTSAQLVARLQSTATGKQALATAHVVSGGGSTNTAADGWPTTFAFSVNADQLSSSQQAGAKQVSVQLTHVGVVISPDASGSYTVSLLAAASPQPMTQVYVGALPAGWYAVAFTLRNVSFGTSSFFVQSVNVENLLDPNNWSSQCASSDLTPDSSGNSTCVVVAHLAQPSNGSTIAGGITAGSADLLGVTISRIST